MLRNIRDKALHAALPLLFSSAVGRLAVHKALDIARQRTGLPIAAEYREEEAIWYITVGEPQADMQVSIRAGADALASLAEELLPDVLEGRKIPPEKILELLRRHMHKTA